MVTLEGHEDSEADGHGLAICRHIAVICLGRLKEATGTIVAETGVSTKFQV
jgi:hypothetical protein